MAEAWGGPTGPDCSTDVEYAPMRTLVQMIGTKAGYGGARVAGDRGSHGQARRVNVQSGGANGNYQEWDSAVLPANAELVPEVRIVLCGATRCPVLTWSMVPVGDSDKSRSYLPTRALCGVRVLTVCMLRTRGTDIAYGAIALSMRYARYSYAVCGTVR
eukprot:2932519-Rhodomonas_salina.2